MDSSVVSDISIKKIKVNDQMSNFESILTELQNLSEKIKSNLKSICLDGERVSSKLLERNQYKCHGFAWFETYRISLRETLSWYKTLQSQGKDTELDS